MKKKQAKYKMSFQLDLSQELKSFFYISDDLFSDVPETYSKRFSEIISGAGKTKNSENS